MIGFSSNKQYSVTQKNDSLFIYKNGKKIKNIDLKGLPTLLDVEISSTGKYLLTNHIDEEGDLHYVWNVDNGNVIHVIRDIELKKWLFGPDGDRLCSSYGEIINLNDFSRAKLQLDNFSYGNENIYITPNGEYIVMWNGSEIAVWNALTYQQIWKKSIGYYNYPIYDVKSDNKGKLLLLTTRRDVQLFDLMSGSFYKQILDNNNLFAALESYFSPDGSSVFIITVRGVYKYDIIPSDKLIYEAKKNLSGRKLTKEERKKYHLE